MRLHSPLKAFLCALLLSMSLSSHAALLKVTGGPVAPLGKTLSSATLKATLLSEYSDGVTRYARIWDLEYDAVNARWKPKGTANGTLAYLPGAAPGDPTPPLTRFVETLTFTDGGNQTKSFDQQLFGTGTNEWAYATVSQGTQAASTLAQFNVKLAPYRAKGDGFTNDTAAIQAAINDARQAGGTVFFPPATYSVTSLSVYAGLILEGYGATLKRPANQPNGTRTLTTPTADLYSGATDSAPLVIRGLTIDGNRANQGAYTGSELDQAQLIALAGSNATPGRLRVILEDLVLLESTSDGILVNHNVDARISNVFAHNCWRGGLVLTGGHSVIQGSKIRVTGTTNARGFDSETDSPGYGGSTSTTLQLSDCYFEQYFDMGVTNSIVTLSNVTVERGSVTFITLGSKVNVIGGSFPMGLRNGSTSRIVYPHNVTFQGTRFVLTESVETGLEADRSLGFDVYFSTQTKQRLRLIDCIWEVGTDVEDTDTLTALYVQPTNAGDDNRVIVVNPSIRPWRDAGGIDRKVDYGFSLAQGGILEVQGGKVVASNPVWFSENIAPGNVEITLDGLSVDGSGKWAHIETHDAASIIRTRNVTVEEADSGISTAFGLANNTYIGGRTILVDSDPTGRLSGLKGDRAVLKVPSGSSTETWVCTGSGIGAAATWTSAQVMDGLQVNGDVTSNTTANSGAFLFNSSGHGSRRIAGTNNVELFTTLGTVYLSASGPGGNQAALSSAGLSLSGSLSVGGGTPVAKLLSTSATLDFPSLSAGDYSDLTMTVTGVAAGDAVQVTPPAAAMAVPVFFQAWVSAPDTVSIRGYNPTGGAIDPASGSFRAVVTKF
ncbi:MAG: glycoside hydrolase family 55 protein [Armatimonadetes bacterium]|nr:glycoside hydrolase family 55 protein [Armatimonadota bacterium]